MSVITDTPVPRPYDAPRGKRIVLIGGAGFIGSALAQRLVLHNQVTIFDNLHRNALALTPLGRGHPNLRLIRGDVLNPHDLDALHGPYDIVVHLSAIAGVGTVVSQPSRTMHVNVIGTYNVLRHFAHQALDRFVSFSTSEVYGPHNFRADEDDATSQGPISQPRWIYAVSKLAAEYLALSYHREFGLPAAVVRPFNVYGPGQVGEGALHHFVRAALKGEPLIVHGDGAPVRSWCFIEDAVDCILRVASLPQAVGRCFNVGNPQATCTVLRLAEEVIRMLNSRSTIELRDIAYPDVQVRVPSIEKAHRLLGFWPQVGLDEGLQRTAEWYRGRAELDSVDVRAEPAEDAANFNPSRIVPPDLDGMLESFNPAEASTEIIDADAVPAGAPAAGYDSDPITLGDKPSRHPWPRSRRFAPGAGSRKVAALIERARDDQPAEAGTTSAVETVGA